MWYLSVKGRPVSKKNSWKRSRTGKVYPSDTVKRWTSAALFQLRSQWDHRPPLLGPLNAAFVVYLDRGQRMDLDNILQTAQDALQAAGIITSDYIIKRLDGSDLRRDESDPRIEITLSDLRMSEPCEVGGCKSPARVAGEGFLGRCTYHDPTREFA